jgi:hypothetical protein
MASNNSFGTITINGQQYVERLQVFNFQIAVASNGQQITQYLTLPGVADFLLKGLTRDTVTSGASTNTRFLFKLGNSDGSIWYMAGGVGGTTDLVLDSLIFGNGQFPYPVIPGIFYSASASIQMQFQDVSNAAPYTIYGAFHGTYLLPVSSS